MHTREALAVAGLALVAVASSTMVALADGARQPTGPDVYAYAEPLAIPYNWSGIYVGGHAGGATAGVDWTITKPIEQVGIRHNGFAGGAQVGVQKQWGQAVLGAELSYTWTDLTGTSSSNVILGATRTSELNNLFLATVRLGATWQNMLAYGKGGYASADVALRSSLTDTIAFSSGGREQGWVAGLGFDYGIRPDIVIGVEYDFI